jgi:type I protein arginine methyltransferase
LNFQSPFTLISKAERQTKVHAFVLYFDTFFAPSGRPIPPETQVQIIEEGSPMLAEVWQVGGRYQPTRRASQGGWPKSPGKEKITSFSTSPKSTPTHWKQTIFLLRNPFLVQEGAVRLLCCYSGQTKFSFKVRLFQGLFIAARTRITLGSLMWRSITL